MVDSLCEIFRITDIKTIVQKHVNNNDNDYRDYKTGLNEQKVNLDDDYIKFIRFSEHMIEKNGRGIVALITNNSYLDGLTQKQMRKHLLETFNDIYINNLITSFIF